MTEQLNKIEAASRLSTALCTVRDRLVGSMHPDGYWEGHLSSSALSTATAVSALAVAVESGSRRMSGERMIVKGCAWLAAHQNADGGWGDSPDSPSNLATAALCVAALKLADVYLGRANGDTSKCLNALAKAEEYVAANAGDDPVAALTAVYGKDRTFAVPILANCALAGMVPWERIPRLPFELAALPHGCYKFLRLHVVSYALPALIAIGLLVDRRKTSRSPFRRLVRRLAERRALMKLLKIQPSGGGFLEAIPLTSFVAMTLTPLYGADHPVAAKCLDFIERSVRPDGSWAIDSNLSVWLTTNAVKALAGAGSLGEVDSERTRRWIADQQYGGIHPYTNSPPGAWAWTHLDGGVPDTDDTSSAMLALLGLGGHDGILGGAHWLLDIQNSDGGWPTFCRGWGRLPFDKSSPDLSAHAMVALAASCENNSAADRAVRRGLQYLGQAQRDDGSWVPLWFGSQSAPGKLNPVAGTSQVLAALAELNAGDEMRSKGVKYLVDAQNEDGGWGGAPAITSTTEETALAVAALSCYNEARAPAARGAEYLVRRIEDGTWLKPAPIGLYFANLWYSEDLYPVIWTLDALGQAVRHGVGVC